MKPTIFILIISITNSLFAQIVTLDSSFGSAGIVTTPNPQNSSEINALAIQPDGKIVAAGYLIGPLSGGYHFQIVRYHSDGTLDNNFGTGGIVNTLIGLTDMPYSMVLQPDGKIIVAGDIRANNSPPFIFHSTIVRYNSDGTLDNSFGAGGIVITIVDTSTSDMISSLALQSDGKIVAGGYAGNQFILMRYNTDGTLDSSFGNGGTVLTSMGSGISNIFSILLQANGKIVATGVTGDILTMKFALARYTTDGALDTTFGTGGKVITDFDSVPGGIASSSALLPDGKIVVAGSSSGGNIALARYNTDGTLDSSFGTGGKTTNGYPGAGDLAIQSDGKIIVSGNVVISSFNAGFSLSRYNTDGTPDSSFGNGGNIVTDINTGNDYTQCLALQQDNKIVVAGSSRESSGSPASFTVVRFTSDLINNTTEISLPYSALHIYPNPTNKAVTLKIIFPSPQQTTISIIDMQGKTIFSETLHNIRELTKELDISSYNKGVYIINVEIPNENITRKIVIK